MAESVVREWFAAAGASATTWNRRRVLLVEDDAGVRGMAERVLTAGGHGVRAVGSVREALLIFWLDPRAPDVLVTDVHLPDGDGRALARHLSTCRPDLAVVLMSGEEVVRGDPASGARPPAFLSKPFVAEELVSAVEATPGAYAPPLGGSAAAESRPHAFE
ncbi:MAG: response regulator [Deltaproteobacteria bacterium]|nr:response regulator [Deltaproteobacteria bacterium]